MTRIRPYIFCHMMTSIDGEIIGKYMDTPEGGAAGDVFYKIEYYVSVDPSERLGWKSSTLTYSDTKVHVLEVLTEKAGNAYKAFLRKLGISYLIAGTDILDYALAMQKQTLFMAREGLSDETPVRFDLQSVEVRNGGSVWRRYRVRTAKGA